MTPLSPAELRGVIAMHRPKLDGLPDGIAWAIPVWELRALLDAAEASLAAPRRTRFVVTGEAGAKREQHTFSTRDAAARAALMLVESGFGRIEVTQEEAA